MESGLKYPTFHIKIKHEGKKAFVFDEIRKKWIMLTPEEWVRQHLINYLVTEKEIPKSLISVEKEIELNGTKKRYDVVVFNTTLNPVLLIECKAPTVELKEEVVEQALRYNLQLGVKYMMFSNGLHDLIFYSQNSKLISLTELPVFKKLAE